MFNRSLLALAALTLATSAVFAQNAPAPGPEWVGGAGSVDSRKFTCRGPDRVAPWPQRGVVGGRPGKSVPYNNPVTEGV